MKCGCAARRGAGASLHASAASASRKPQIPASRLPTANASLPVLQLYTAVVREIAAAAGGLFFTFCGAENFTTTERLFHILHMQNISLIFELLWRFFLFIRKHERLERRIIEQKTSSQVLFSTKSTIRVGEILLLNVKCA